jgi:LytS/YehU family sensor histidine kinase
LEKELYIVKDYLALENMRFEDRLKIEYQVDEDTLDQPVPPMMLQTLVENAIKHGISKQINGGVVRVISAFRDQYHELSVQNTGRLNGEINNEAHAGPNGTFELGFGLSSTNDRLGLLYGNKAKFEIRQATPTLVEAKVSIPFENDLR